MFSATNCDSFKDSLPNSNNNYRMSSQKLCRKGWLCAVLGELTEVTHAGCFVVMLQAAFLSRGNGGVHTNDKRDRAVQEYPLIKTGISPFKLKLNYFLYSEAVFSLMRIWKAWPVYLTMNMPAFCINRLSISQVSLVA